MSTFIPFPKLHRLSRTIVVTEKIDGSNAQIWIAPPTALVDYGDAKATPIACNDTHWMFAGSRSRWLTPTKNEDNFGFAAWCRENADELFKLGEGRHYGEWYGKGIQRNYGLNEKRFALFNTSQWGETRPACCDVVPTLYTGAFDTLITDYAMDKLALNGSYMVPGFKDPEGIVVYHTAARTSFKKTFEHDASGKEAA